MIAVFLSLSATSTPRAASTYFVSPSGSNGNTCAAAKSASTPRQSIASGISCLVGGDTLSVGNGTYVEKVNGNTIPNGSSGAPTIIKATNKRQAILKPTNAGGGQIFILGGSGNNKQWITVDGLAMDGTDSGEGTNGMWIDAQAGSDHILMTGLEIHHLKGNNSSQTAVVTNGLTMSWTVTDVIARDIYIHDIGYQQVAGGACNECYAYCNYLSGAGYTWENSQCINASGFALHGYTSGAGGASNNTVRNNYFQNTGGGFLMCQSGNKLYNNVLNHVGATNFNAGNHFGIRINVFCSGQPSSNNVVAFNTIFDSDGNCMELGGMTNSTVQNNICFQNGADTITGGGSGNNFGPAIGGRPNSNLLATNPQFVNSGAGDFHLLASSPGNNTGVAVSGVTTDLSGVTRGNPPDVGAYEIGSSDTVAPTILITNVAGTVISPASASVSQNVTSVPFTVQGTSSDNVGVSSVTAACSPACGSPAVSGTTSWSTSLSPQTGTSTVTFTAKDAANNSGTATLTVSYNPPPPSVVTVFVDTASIGGTANDSQPCASADITHPRKTIAAGIVCLQAPGSRLFIRQGTYNETIDSSSTPIVSGSDAAHTMLISSYNNEVVTLQGAPGGSHIIIGGATDHHIVLNGLTIAAGASNVGLMFFGGTHDNVFQNGEISNTAFEVVYNGGTDNAVIRTKIHDTVSTTLPLIRTDATSLRFKIDQCEIYNNDHEGYLDDNSASNGTIFTRNYVHNVGTAGFASVAARGNGHQFYNNIIVGGTQGIDVAGPGQNWKIFNNTVYGATFEGIVLDSGTNGNQVKNNIAFGNGNPAGIVNNGATTTLSNNITTDPSFVDAPNGDFHIPATSVAKGAGATLSEVTIDFAGTARTVPYDAGAYVATSATPPPPSNEGVTGGGRDVSWSKRAFFQ